MILADPVAAPRAPWRPAERNRAPRLAGLLALLGLVGVAAALAWHPLVVLFAIPILGGWVGGFAFGPLAFLCFAAATAGFSFGWVEGLGLSIAGRAINPNGLHWGMTFGIAVLLLARWGAGSLPTLFRPYAALVALSAVSLLWAPDWFDGLKQVLQYAIPLLLGWLAYRTLDTRDDVAAVVTAWLVGLAFSAGVAMVMMAVAPGAQPGLGGVLGNRAFGIYLLPLFALALAGAREGSTVRGILAAGIFFLSVLTLSRTVTAVMLALALLALLHGHGLQRAFAVLLVIGSGWLALQYEPLRERFFLHSNTGFGVPRLEIVGRGTDSQLAVGNLNLSGRGLAWLQTWQHAQEQPLLGHGSGGATVYLERELGIGISHPHNDYLRILHDLGWVGFVALLFTAGFVLHRMWRLHRRATDPWAREWSYAGLLAWVAYLMIAVTDNSMIYATFFTGSVFMLLAIAQRASEEGETGPDVPSLVGSDRTNAAGGPGTS